MMGRMMREYLLPLFGDFQFTKYLKHDPIGARRRGHARVPGRPRMAGRIAAKRCATSSREMYKEVGGFGTLLLFTFDYADNPEPWFKSMRLLAEEVLPHFDGLERRPSRARSRPRIREDARWASTASRTRSP